MSIRVTNESVANAWYNNTPALNHGGTFKTDGDVLYSYAQRIGFTTDEGTKVLLDYTAKTGNFLSMTTSTKHVSPARHVAHITLNPSVVSNLEKFKGNV